VYRLSVSRSGFVTLVFGQRRPAEAVKTIDLAEGQRVAANVALPRGSAIAGRIVDDAGEPVADVAVQVMRARMADGRRRVEPLGVVDTTDDRGAFRLYGLEPGDYYVMAMVRSPTPEDARMTAFSGPIRGDIKSTVPVFFPGVPSLDQAQPVSLVLGADARADIFLSPLRTARISGVVLDSTGAPAADATVQLLSAGLAFGFSPSGPPPLSISAHAEPDGSFELANVPPGVYTLVTRVQNQRLRGTLDGLMMVAADSGSSEARLKVMQQAELLVSNMGEVAAMPVAVDNADISGLTLVTAPGGTLTATFAADAGVSRPLPPDLRVEAIGGTQVGVMNDSFTTNGIRQMRLAGLSGPTRLRVTGLPESWAVKAIMAGGADVTDAPINVRGGNVDVRIVLTDRVTEVSGTLPPAPASPAEPAADRSGREPYVVVFAADSARWAYPSRFVRSTRADARGGFRIAGLPAHERYLAVALEYLENGEADDPQFLERMRNRATTFSLNDGERKTINVRVVPR
jgi:hypothetical protein